MDIQQLVQLHVREIYRLIVSCFANSLFFIAYKLAFVGVFNTKTNEFVKPAQKRLQVPSSILPTLPLPSESWENVTLLNLNQTGLKKKKKIYLSNFLICILIFKGLYPIMSLSYMIVYQDQTTFGLVGAALRSFLQWIMSPYMQAQIQSLDSSALPDDVVSRNLDAANSMMIDPNYANEQFVWNFFFVHSFR